MTQTDVSWIVMEWAWTSEHLCNMHSIGKIICKHHYYVWVTSSRV